jgi:preprotein translocase subunit SecG
MLGSILLGLHVLLSVALIVLVLLQRGKGADMGAAFGAGASGTVFGARGAANFLTRSTAVLATVFFVNSLTLAWLATQRIEDQSVLDRVRVEEPAPAPAEEASGPDDLPPVPQGLSGGQGDMPDLPPPPD